MALYRNTTTIPSAGGANYANINTVADFVFNNIVAQSIPPITVIKSSPGGSSAYSNYVLKVANSGHYLSIAMTSGSQCTIGIYNIAYSSMVTSTVLNFSIGDNLINNILTTSNLLSFSVLDSTSGTVVGVVYFNTNNNNWYATLSPITSVYPPSSDAAVTTSQSFGYCTNTDTYILTPTLLSSSSSFNLLSLISDTPIPIVAFSSSSSMTGLSNGHAYTGAGLNWLYLGYTISADSA